MSQRSVRALKPLKSALRYRQVRDRIRDYILDNKLRGGDRLPTETGLAARLGVSRNAVREALRALEAEGIIETRRGSGNFVREVVLDDLLASFTYSLFFDSDSVVELYHIRQKLEEHFLPTVMANLAAESIGELRRLLANMKANTSREKQYIDYDIRLHRAIFNNVGNRTLLKLFDIFDVIYRRTGYALDQLSPTERKKDLAAHTTLVDALERRDLRGALRALETTWNSFPTFRLEARVQRPTSPSTKPARGRRTNRSPMTKNKE
jgi:DNA-binding FadR family transcriptional regulator